MSAPERIETARLVLRKPEDSDADAIFARYSGDVEVARFMAWPMHRSVDDTKMFLVFSRGEWEKWPAGPYLIESKADERLLGSTGLSFESLRAADTGYVLARDAWGLGYATEALGTMVTLARDLGVERLSAMCHASHAASARVLEKCGFTRESRIERYKVFPNLGTGQPEDCLIYIRRPQALR